MNKLISAMALMAAVASIAPLGAAAADSVTTAPVVVESKPQVIARIANPARDQQLSQAEHYRGVLDPQTPAELQAYWNRVNPMLLGG
ncbi:MAG: hypothetical protein ABSE64_03250 [Vulcanimicrobiaceae bacterium]